MTMHRRHLFLALLGAAALPRAQAEAAARSSGPPNGSLLLIGGGARGPAIQTAAIRLSRAKDGRPGRWVYVPTAGTDEEIRRSEPPAFIARSGASVSVLHTRERAVADSESFVAPLRSATAVFFDGGRQWRLADAYLGTRSERAFRTVLERGGLVAGTSAGATIQGSYLVRGSPAGNGFVMAPGHEQGFAYLANVAVDQHVIVRGRQADLVPVVATHPGLLGIGIDEGTAAMVVRNMLTVIGKSVVLVTDGADHAGRPYYALAAGERFDLATWTRLPRE